MLRVSVAAAAITITFAAFASSPAQAQVTAYEGARLIVGNGTVIENATIVVDGARIAQAGANVKAPAGAKRVDLKGKTVMPMIIDTHVHLSPTRERLIRDLKQRAYWGVSAAASLGSDNYDLLDMRAEMIPGAARFFSAGQGITMPEPGRVAVPRQQWITTEAEARNAVQELVRRKVDIVKLWVDDRGGKYPKLTPELYGAIIDEAHKHKLRVAAHIFNMEDAKGLMKAGLDIFAHGVRDKDIDDETVAMFKARPHLVLMPNLPDRGVKVDRSWMQAGMTP